MANPAADAQANIDALMAQRAVLNNVKRAIGKVNIQIAARMTKPEFKLPRKALGELAALQESADEETSEEIGVILTKVEEIQEKGPVLTEFQDMTKAVTTRVFREMQRLLQEIKAAKSELAAAQAAAAPPKASTEDNDDDDDSDSDW